MEAGLEIALAEAIEIAAVAFGGAAGPEAFEAGSGFPLFGGEAAALDAGFGFAVEGLGDGGWATLLGEGEDFDFVFRGVGSDAERVAGLDGACGLGVDTVGLDAAEVTGASGEGAGFEEAGGPEPFVDADAVHASIVEVSKRKRLWWNQGYRGTKMKTTGWLLGLVAVAMMAAEFPDPALDQKPAKGLQKAVLAGGCFWCTEAVFELVEGVKKVESGYAGGAKETADYRRVSMGDTGHAECIEVTYDPAVVTYGQLLRVFFEVAHDPTTKNRQGPDVGPQYRSAVFYVNDEQKQVAEAYIRQLDAARVFKSRIVTEVVPLKGFYAAEGYHQDYAAQNPENPYIAYNAAPKVAKLKKACPRLVKRK